MKKLTVTQGAVIALVVVGLLVVALLGYFVLVRPQHAKAHDLAKQIEETQQQLTAYRAANLAARNAPKIRVADLFRLTKAMPNEADMPGLVLELNRIAEETGISFDSIAPRTATVVSGYQVVPISLVFQGNYYDLSDFLYRLRNLVDVRGGTLDATGRLFTVDTVEFAEGDKTFPQIRATLTVDAFVFGTSPPATATPPPATTPPAGTTPATTPATTPLPTPSAGGATAAPSASAAGTSTAAGGTP